MAEKEPTEIRIPYPEAADLDLRISVGACRFRLGPGEDEPWVEGTYVDPTGSLPVRVSQEGGTARIRQTQSFADMFGLLSGIPRFDLRLGKAHAYMLTLEGGASDNDLDLGGLPITRLAIRHGAGKIALDFPAPNPQVMSLLSLGTGAGEMEIRSLANANFAEMSVDGGAASYKFDFGGTLRRNAHVRIATATSSVEIRMPGSTAAKITFESMLGSLDVGDGFIKKEGAFWTPAGVEGKTPLLTINTNVALGALRIRLA